jgi:hypothetical protein
MTEEEKIDAAIAQWHAKYYAAIVQWQADHDALLQSLLNPSMSRRENRRWEKAQRRLEQLQRKKAKRKK